MNRKHNGREGGMSVTCCSPAVVQSVASAPYCPSQWIAGAVGLRQALFCCAVKAQARGSLECGRQDGSRDGGTPAPALPAAARGRS
eukprot:CAMPEP_0206040202 /NCGR_PEP_ID=MMETSP1466-20131121/5242_1 /ASSEMBLY_ACC=CAM_ASM_001126 /TAXON_ID=44452 /ORGANISM="Pavlova gyrans, Strain CCMP608" /LENGTH=85 /DNA_ID=CAMNT_0053414867 /DNA_START=357 /DNA_END=610 /DNA_ORIENTATION=+